MLANGVVFADDELRELTFVFQILRCRTNGGKRINCGSRADYCVAIHNHVRLQRDGIIQLNGRPDHAVGSDTNIFADLGLGTNDSGRMDVGHGHAVRRLAASINSHSIAEMQRSHSRGRAPVAPALSLSHFFTLSDWLSRGSGADERTGHATGANRYRFTRNYRRVPTTR